MKNLFLAILILVSCNNIENKSSKKIFTHHAKFIEVVNFFGLENKDYFNNQELMLYKNVPDDNNHFPFLFFGMDSFTLSNSTIFKRTPFTILILDCPYNNEFGLFYKFKGNKPILINQGRYLPKVEINLLYDSIYVCQFIYENNYSSSYSDLRFYYFFEKNGGLINLFYRSADKKSSLNLSKPVITKKRIEINDFGNENTIYISNLNSKKINITSINQNNLFPVDNISFDKVEIGNRP